jgi:hypothetical protein
VIILTATQPELGTEPAAARCSHRPKDPKLADPALRAKLDETRARFEQLADGAGVELRYTAE